MKRPWGLDGNPIGRLLLLCCAGACATGARGGGADRALGGAGSPRDDAVLIGDYSEVVDVAVGDRTAFVAATGGLAFYDRTFRRWLPPLPLTTLSDRISLIAADRASNGVWIGGLGSISYYDVTLDRPSRAYVSGRVDLILFDQRDLARGAYVRSGGRWSLVTTTGFVTPLRDERELPPPGSRLIPITLQQLYEEHPSLRAFSGLLVRNAGLVSAPVTSGSRAPNRDEVWLGTYGNGAFLVDPLFNQATPLPFGIRGRAATALAVVPDGIWVGAIAGAGLAGPGGVSFASADLQQWNWLDHNRMPLLRSARITDLVVRGSTVWIATDRGVGSLTTQQNGLARTWSGLHGLPSDHALSLVVTDEGTWVGTTRGLAFLRPDPSRATDDVVSERLLADVAVRALLRTSGTLWIGSDAGLFALKEGMDSSVRPARPAGSVGDARLRRPIVALASFDSVLVVATENALVAVHARTGEPLPVLVQPDVARLAGITAMAMDARTLWVTGRRGLLVVDRATAVARFASGFSFASVMHDVALDARYAWIGTSEGLLRLKRLPDGTLP